MKNMTRVLAVLAAFSLLLAGCEQKGEGEGQADKKVHLVYVEWSDAVASTNVMKVVLEKMGYEVKTTPLSAAAMWQGVASNDADAMVAAWLPTTHGHYLEAVRENVVDLGPNLEGAKIGLVVPPYVNIESISELNDHPEKFDRKIIGIDPGAGIMSATEKALVQYELERFKLIEGSGATMTAALKGAIKNKEWIVVTGWTPHWMFARWEGLKYLKDPKKVFGEEETVNTVVRKGLEQDMPEVYRVLDRFEWSTQDVETIMDWNQQPNADPYENAKKWVEQNPEKVQSWMQ